MSRNASVAWMLVALAIIAVLPLGAAAQGTSAASISGVVTDSSGGIVPGVAIEVSSPVLIEKIRTTTTNERGEYRIVELRPGTYTVTFARQGFTSFRHEGIELTSNFNAAVNAELRVGVLGRRALKQNLTDWPRQISVQPRHLQSLQQQRHPLGQQHIWTEVAVADLHVGCAINQVRDPVRLLNFEA